MAVTKNVFSIKRFLSTARSLFRKDYQNSSDINPVIFHLISLTTMASLLELTYMRESCILGDKVEILWERKLSVIQFLAMKI